MDDLQRHGDTEEPLRQITTMVVYLDVGKRADDRDTAEDLETGGQDNAHGRDPDVTEDAQSISSR